MLIYESGTIGARPEVLPLSIGDGELAQTAACVVPLAQIFSDYLQAGRVDVGFLSAAQIDRFGNLNTTVIGPYSHPCTRLPGAGGAPEIAAHAKQTFVMLKATLRSFVPTLDFCTSSGRGPSAVICDFGVLTPDSQSGELTLTALFADVAVEQVCAAIGWPLVVAEQLDTIAAPRARELDTLRALNARTQKAHAQPVRVPLREK